MKSGIRVFARNNFKSAKGLLLPIEEFKYHRNFDLTKMDPEKCEVIMKRAEEFLVEEIVPIPLSLYRDKFLTGSRTNYESVHHHRRDMLCYMLIAEMYEDKGRFVEKIADVLWAIMEESSWVIPAHQANSHMRPNSDVPEIYREEDVPGLDLYSANCGAVLAVTKYYLKDKLDAISPYICERIDHLVYLRTVRPYIVGTYWWSYSAHNWPTGISMNVLVATAATVSDMEIRERVVEKAMWMLDNFSAGMPEDGTCDEGPGYWGAGAGGFFNAMLLLDDLSAGKINVYDDVMVRNLCEFISKVNIHDKYFVNFADCHGKVSPDGDLIEIMGKMLRSDELLSFGHTMSLERANIYYFFGAPYTVVRNVFTPTVHKVDPVVAKKSVWMDGHKIAVFRESTDTSKGLFLATKGGTNSEPGNHNDVGALIIFSDGKPIAVDPGIGSYNNKYFESDYRYLRWFTNSNAHSCPEINGYQQKTGGSSSDEVCDVDARTVSMEIGKLYKPEAGIESLVRTCHLEDGLITVSDALKLSEEGEYIFHLNLVNEPQIREDGKVEIGEGRVLSYDPEVFTVSYDRVENKCLPYDDLNIQHWWGVECLWDLKLTAAAKDNTFTVTIR